MWRCRGARHAACEMKGCELGAREKEENVIRTIMAYADECDAITDYCPRIQHYSNPNVVDAWFTTGSPVHDNARLIRQEAPTLALYRDSQGRIFKNGFD